MDPREAVEDGPSFEKKMIAGLPAAHSEGRYRCFLPDLAGFAIYRREGANVTTAYFTQKTQKVNFYFLACVWR